MQYDVIIVGAGAAGLTAMKELSAAGYRTCLLEATEKAGGRIKTIHNEFKTPVEAGAEFIHGDAPVTFDLLKQAQIPYKTVEGKMIPLQNGIWFKEESRDDYSDLLMEKLEQLEKDCTIKQFLDEHLHSLEYEAPRNNIQQFSEGFGLADINKASVFALRKEWKQQDEEQYRVHGGYQQLVNYLLESGQKNNATIHFSSPVQSIAYSNESVIVSITNGKEYRAPRLIITVSAGILQSDDIRFVPSLPPTYQQAIQHLGFGSVIKFLFQFKEPFWEKQSGNLGFVLSNEWVPTWWTQLPEHNCLLTGWLGGPGAKTASRLSNEELTQFAISSLANIFQADVGFIHNRVSHHQIICWNNQPYIKGGYSYSTIESDNAKNILLNPVNDIIYFAGEAIYNGEFQGTVEAALASGLSAALMIKNENASARTSMR
jgi:monoamine oxidase